MCGRKEGRRRTPSALGSPAASGRPDWNGFPPASPDAQRRVTSSSWKEVDLVNVSSSLFFFPSSVAPSYNPATHRPSSVDSELSPQEKVSDALSRLVASPSHTKKFKQEINQLFSSHGCRQLKGKKRASRI